MEDVLDIYQRPYDPLNPVVCIDETNKQLIKETRIPCALGQPEKVDSEYERNGVANVLRFTSDVMYPLAEKIVLITDNLNTHSFSSLYKAFPPEEARRIANRFEWHYTPKHGSWLDMAEIEIGIICRQALSKPLPDMESFKRQIKSWNLRRNTECPKGGWRLSSTDVRIKLKRLYPTIL